MKIFIKSYWKILLVFALVGLVGGYFTGIYSLQSYPVELQQEILAQGITQTLLGLITAAQSACYGLILGALGILLAKKVGLWRDKLELLGKPVFITMVVAVIGGLCLILPDLLFFGKYSPEIRDSYLVKPTIAYILASIAYGGVIEEVMLRLFFMSLIAYLWHKLFEKGKEQASVTALIVANVLSAILFAAGHLPATFLILGSSPMILFRCFLLNGGFGLAFGWLYRKYGLQYAMLAHGGCHVISKLIWILFI